MGSGCGETRKLTVTKTIGVDLAAIVTNDFLSDVYSYLMAEVFPNIIQSNPKLLDEIKAFDGDLRLVDNAFFFTVPALFQFVCKLLARHSGRQIESGRENYLHFRKQLYSNPTNSQLKKIGGHIEIESAKPKHDLSIYKLRPISS